MKTEIQRMIDQKTLTCLFSKHAIDNGGKRLLDTFKRELLQVRPSARFWRRHAQNIPNWQNRSFHHPINLLHQLKKNQCSIYSLQIKAKILWSPPHRSAMRTEYQESLEIRESHLKTKFSARNITKQTSPHVTNSKHLFRRHWHLKT